MTSAVVAAVFGFGMNANAKSAASEPASHSHSADSYTAHPKKDELGRTVHQPEGFADYEGDVHLDSDGRATYIPHMEDAALDNNIGSPQAFDHSMDNVNTPRVK